MKRNLKSKHPVESYICLCLIDIGKSKLKCSLVGGDIFVLMWSS